MEDLNPLERLRELVHEPPAPESWAAICDLFDAWPDASVEVGLAYAREHLARWPEALRTPPPHWELALALGRPVAGWPLAAQPLRLLLCSVGPRKLNVIKAIYTHRRDVVGNVGGGLREAKALADSAPVLLPPDLGSDALLAELEALQCEVIALGRGASPPESLPRPINFTGWDLSRRRLRGWELSSQGLVGVSFKSADLSGANLTRASVQYSNLSGASLEGACLHRANLDFTQLASARLVGADMRRCSLAFAQLEGADFSGANLEKANLYCAVYDRATRWPEGFDPVDCGALGPGARLQDANLEAMRLNNIALTGIDLTGAFMERADLSGTDLEEATLVEANLEWADLRGANLRGADLRGANLSGADLTGADLTGASLYGVQHDSDTTWPEGWRPPG